MLTAAAGVANVTGAGPETWLHAMLSEALGSPSSETVPVSVTGMPGGAARSGPASTLGAVLAAVTLRTTVSVAVAPESSAVRRST